MSKSKDTKTCTVCGDEFDARRMFPYCVKCGKNQPKDQYVGAAFGTKGNGAHVTKLTHGEV